MGILNKIIKSVVYHCTEKPEHYVHVDEPKTMQERRQVQYNNWCKAKGVYNGSYLPKNPNLLMSSGKKGWVEMTSCKDGTSNHRIFRRKSSGQVVDYNGKTLTNRNTMADEHYHWRTASTIKGNRKISNAIKYRDRYGNTCSKGSKESHLAPLDKKYIFK